MTKVVQWELVSGSEDGEGQTNVAVVRIDRPEVHNAVDAAVLKGLEQAIRAIKGSDARAVVLTGSGTRTFCAGADLSWLAGRDDHGEGLELCRRMESLLAGLADGDRPILAAIGGDAFGGGCELALACHLRIASSHARFCFRQTAMGLVTGWGGGRRLFRQVGRSAALHLLLTAEPIDAAEALRIGLVDRVVPGARVLDETLALARRIAAGAPGSVRAFLELARAVDAEGAATGESAAAVEAALFAKLWDGEDFAARLDAWRARRS